MTEDQDKELLAEMMTYSDEQLADCISYHAYEQGMRAGYTDAYKILLDFAAGVFKSGGEDTLANQLRSKAISIKFFGEQRYDKYCVTNGPKKRDFAYKILCDRGEK